MTLAAARTAPEDLADAYRAHTTLMPVQAQHQRALACAGETFLAAHPDLDAWMDQSVDARLVELSRRPRAWPVVIFAMLSGRCHVDLDFLFAKHLGHSAGRTVSIFYPDEVRELREAARRLGTSEAAFKKLLGRMIPLVIAGCGVALRCTRSLPSSSTSSAGSSPRLSASASRCAARHVASSSRCVNCSSRLGCSITQRHGTEVVDRRHERSG